MTRTRRLMSTALATLGATVAVAGPAQAETAAFDGSYGVVQRLTFNGRLDGTVKGFFSETGDPAKRQGFAFKGKFGTGTTADDLKLSGVRTSSGDGATSAYAITGGRLNSRGFQQILLGRALVTFENGHAVHLEATGLTLFGSYLIGSYKLVLNRTPLTSPVPRS